MLLFEGADYRIFLSNLLLPWCEVCRWRTLKIPFRVLSRYISGQFSNRSSFWWNCLHMFLLTAAAAAKLLQSCLTLCDPIDGSPPGSPIPGIFQARTLEWVAISFFNAKKVKSESEVAQSCWTLSDLMDYSLPGSSVHGIFQARVLEWGAIAVFC